MLIFLFEQFGQLQAKRMFSAQDLQRLQHRVHRLFEIHHCDVVEAIVVELLRQVSFSIRT